MTETQSYPFDLITSPLFLDNHNISFSKSDFDGTAKFQIVLASDCPNNVGDCLNSNGLLTASVSIFATADVSLSLTEVLSEDNVYVRNSAVSLTNDVEIPLNEDGNVKGVFLRKKSNNFVIAFMIDTTPMRYCEKVLLEEGNILFKVIR